VHQIKRDYDVSSAGDRLKNVFFTVTVTIAFVLGLYSLFLASANADNVQPSTIAGLLRTATSADAEKIEIALGALAEQDLAYVVLYTTEVGPDPKVETAARRAARALTESGMAVSVRLLGPGDPDFTMIVAQNGVGRFPAVLAVKKDGGIVLVTDEINEKNLLHAYQGVWGKTSSCDDSRSAVY
jgi:hypothetical protein